jgi:hypothetical protein
MTGMLGTVMLDVVYSYGYIGVIGRYYRDKTSLKLLSWR